MYDPWDHTTCKPAWLCDPDAVDPLAAIYRLRLDSSRVNLSNGLESLDTEDGLSLRSDFATTPGALGTDQGLTGDKRRVKGTKAVTRAHEAFCAPKREPGSAR
jgi:hypothetical protein